MKKAIIWSCAVFIGVSVASCGGGEPEDTSPKYNFERADSLPEGYLEELGIVKTNIEVTAKLYQHMNEQGYAFNESLLMSPSKTFSGSSKQAMGIGAIGSDLVYSASFGQNQSAMERMKGLLNAANSLGVGEAFDEELLTKMSSDDSTINKSVLLTKAYLKAKDQLFSNERAQYATFMIIGGWVEGLHIASNALKEGGIKDNDIKIGFWEMCNSYESVMHLTKVFENNAEMQAVAEKIQGLSETLNPIKKNAKKYNEEHVARLAAAATQLRNELF
ncbi:MAG: hypothetical protein Kow0075_04670 [Salibacteraceae bacterium]